MALAICHLWTRPEMLPTAAEAIYETFWRGRPGYSAEYFARRLREASDPGRIPLCLVALLDGDFVGTASLIENDDETRLSLRPWLAAVLVRRDLRGRGIGSALVRAMLVEARRLGEARLYLGTDSPGFYLKLGADWHERTGQPIQILRFGLDEER